MNLRHNSLSYRNDVTKRGTQIHNSFSLQVIDHYENPRNVGKLDSKKASVGTGLVGAPACGDVMKLQVIVE